MQSRERYQPGLVPESINVQDFPMFMLWWAVKADDTNPLRNHRNDHSPIAAQESANVVGPRN
jgi:hypothetical protein